MQNKNHLLRGMVTAALALLLSLPQFAVAQQPTVNVRGRVIYADGAPIIGAGVVCKADSKIGTVTDVDGRFSIKYPSDGMLVVSYVGMKTVEVKANAATEMVITLQEDNESLKSAIVTGIVDKRQETFTGSSVTYTGDELRSIGVQNPIASLRSLDPAFVLLENDAFGSDPNHLPNIEIRGKSSMLGLRDELSEDPNQPLFILDGFESTLSAIYNLDVSRIASITILKDAASTAIYGSKAANGVVVVETVKPVAGKLRLSYSGSLDVTIPDLSSYNLMNAQEKLEFEKLAGHYSASGSASEIIAMDNFYNQRLAMVGSGVDTYWLSEPLRIGLNNRHDLYVDGGADGFMFGIGLNYNDVNGVMKTSNRDGLGGRIDLTYRIGKLNFSNKFSALSTGYTDPIVSFSEYAMANPYCKKYAEDGSLNRLLIEESSLESAMGNPMWNDSLNSRNASKDLLISDYFNVEYNPIDGLRLRARAGLTYNTYKNENFISPDDTRFESTNRLRRGSFTDTDRSNMKYEGDFTASYGKVFGEIHNVNIALGGKISESNTLTQGYTVYGFPSGEFTYPSFSNGYNDGARPTYTESVVREASAYLIGSYALKDRYLLDASYRLNGASVFGSNKKYI
ncbi:MAG: TonB-dependent receptor plug domain-containing protein, partial [Bacteroidales bacterium]|nr:TonB-dependent receptor plug domain-containing protein [Bacteroidales bacterium]